VNIKKKIESMPRTSEHIAKGSVLEVLELFILLVSRFICFGVKNVMNTKNSTKCALQLISESSRSASKSVNSLTEILNRFLAEASVLLLDSEDGRK